jgi:hypothetical protein
MMKKKHGIFFGISVSLIAVIFILAVYDNPAGGGGENDDVSKS